MDISKTVMNTFKLATSSLAILTGKILWKETKKDGEDIPEKAKPAVPEEKPEPQDEFSPGGIFKRRLEAVTALGKPGLPASLTVSQYSQVYGMSKTTVRNWIKSGKLKSYKDVHGRIFVNDEIDEIPVLDFEKNRWHLIPSEDVRNSADGEFLYVKLEWNGREILAADGYFRKKERENA